MCSDLNGALDKDIVKKGLKRDRDGFIAKEDLMKEIESTLFYSSSFSFSGDRIFIQIDLEELHVALADAEDVLKHIFTAVDVVV